MVKRIVQKIKNLLQKRIDNRNRRKLRNQSPTLVCSNCTGGFLYHWLGLRFNSPFINLFLTPNDFVTALENWDEFIQGDINEIDTSLKYPVGQIVTGGGEVLIHFMHYKTFKEAKAKWLERLDRMEKDVNHIGFMLTNWQNDDSVLERFDNLPFPHKKAFAFKDYPSLKSVFHLTGFENVKGEKNIYATQKLNGKRYIDQFDYVDFINSLQD